jgi:1-acyl-sn-glycerol-3-phosphate acyltransferase
LRFAAGEEISLDDLRGKPVTAATLDEATTRMMDAITVLVAELRQATPPARRYDPDNEKTTGDQT